jgi:hypothetical protein
VGQRLAFLIGNQDFDEALSGLKPLRGAHNDVAALAEVLGAPERGGFTLETLLERNSWEIVQRLDAAVERAGPDDLLLVFYAGHGVWSRGGFCLATADTRKDSVLGTSISSQQLANVLKDSLCTVVLLLDCCYSGGAAPHFHRGDAASALKVLADQVKGCFVLTASTATQTAQETEEDGMVLGRFTAAVRRGLVTGAAAPRDEDSVRFQSLRLWVEREVRGQTPQHAIGQGAFGDPVIAHVPRGGREHRRLDLLGRWLAAREIGAVEHAEMSAALLGDGDVDTRGAELLREMLDRPNARAAAVLSAWHAARMPRPPEFDSRKDVPPKPAGGADLPPAPMPKAPVVMPDQPAPGWTTVPVALIAGAPAGLVLAASPQATPDTWIVALAVCGLGVAAAAWLARPLAGYSFAQAALRLGLALAALVTLSAVTLRSPDDLFQWSFLLLGMSAGLAAWRLVAMPLAEAARRKESSPLAAYVQAAAAAGVLTFLLLVLANEVFGPGLAFRVTRYDGEVSGAVLAAVLASLAVPVTFGAAAALRRPKGKSGS